MHESSSCMEVTYQVLYTKNAIKDIRKLKAAKLAEKVQKLCDSLTHDPIPTRSKHLVGDLRGKYSIRINIKHRLVYEIIYKKKIIKILSMWSHYGDN